MIAKDVRVLKPAEGDVAVCALLGSVVVLKYGKTLRGRFYPNINSVSELPKHVSVETRVACE